MIPEMTAVELREISRKVSIYADLRPGASLTRREIRLAGIFALVWFAMDGFWFISTLNHWFGL